MPNDITDMQAAEPYDIVIVGGGIAGLYCCHELIKKRESLKINSILLLPWMAARRDVLETYRVP